MTHTAGVRAISKLVTRYKFRISPPEKNISVEN